MSSSAGCAGGGAGTPAPLFVGASLAERLYQRDCATGDALFRAPRALRPDAHEAPYADDEYEAVRAGRAFLTATSDFFRALYDGGMAEAVPGSLLTIDDADAGTLRALLRCAYTGAVPDDCYVNIPRLVSLCALAQRTLLEPVRDEALNTLLIVTCNYENAYQLLGCVYHDERCAAERELACAPAIDVAVKVSSSCVIYNHDDNAVTTQFLRSSPRVMAALLSKLTSVNCSGDRLLSAVCEWANAQVQATSSSVFNASSAEPAAKRARTDISDVASSSAATDDGSGTSSLEPLPAGASAVSSLILDVLCHIPLGTVTEAAIVRFLAVETVLPQQAVMDILKSKVTGAPQGGVTARQLSRLLCLDQQCYEFLATNSAPPRMVTSGMPHGEHDYTAWFYTVHNSASEEQAQAIISSCLEPRERPKGRIVEADLYFRISTFARIRLLPSYSRELAKPAQCGASFYFERSHPANRVVFVSEGGGTPVDVTGRVLILRFRSSADYSELRFSLVDAASGYELSTATIPSTPTDAPVINVITEESDCPAGANTAKYKAGLGCAAQLDVLFGSFAFDPSVGAAAPTTVGEPAAAGAGAGAGGGGGGGVGDGGGVGGGVAIVR
jgi:hypothetical protein